MNWRPNALNARRAPTAEVLIALSCFTITLFFDIASALHIKTTRETSLRDIFRFPPGR